MSMARLVVTAVRVEGRSISAVARDYHLSRRWIHELLRRYDTEGEAGLQPRSRRPHASPQRTQTPSRTRSSSCARPSPIRAWTPAPIPSPTT
jgi:transposase